jgi:murein DD-endopeptidase MepM/ murein hydrolase activator NlpD
MRQPRRRSPEQLKRAGSRRGWLAKLRKREKGASGGYPLGAHGTLIGTPFAGTHTLGNWQSDNAVDLGVPIGTAMIAVDSGRVVKVSPHPQDGGRFAGDAITIVGDHGNSFFYKHGVSNVKVGQRVHKGQKIGTSGSAVGVPHLHFGIKHGDPRDLIHQHK